MNVKKIKEINKKKYFKLTFHTKCALCILPSLIGLCIFYIIPYFRVLYYSLIKSQFKREFVGFFNYIKTWNNEYFRLALKNSLLLIIICIPILIICALLISLVLSFYMKKTYIRMAYILPMLVPTAGIVLIWKRIFSEVSSVMPIYTLFIWKNIGICIILITAAFSMIDNSIHEAAKIDGANGFKLHTKITIPIIMPSIVFSILLSIVNSFKVFKESYLYYSSKYPPNHSYTLQYYINNNFQKFDYQSLAASSIMTSALIMIIVAAGLYIQDKYRC